MDSRTIKEWNRVPLSDKRAAVSSKTDGRKLRKPGKAKTCKKTKGDHLWEGGYWYSTSGRVREKKCLCGKKLDWEFLCKRCGIWHKTVSCPKCGHII